MTKKIFISTNESLASGKLQMPEIGLCRYLDFKTKKKGLNNEDLLHIWEYMQYIRVCEETLKEIKNKQKYINVDVALKGPLHLAIGQEAACVGQAYALSANDYSFGNHRSHGELLARSLKAIGNSSDYDLEKIMSNYLHGYIFNAINPFMNDLSWKKKATIFVLYGFFSEILGNSTGFQKGIGGSMHVFFPPFGVFPSNAIVGASAPIASGAALFMKNNDEKTISVANLGDGATGCGIVNEAMNFSAMKQFDTLWDKKGGLPILFAFFNNGYGMGGQTVGETMAYDKLARIGAGIGDKALISERINGMDPLAVYYWTKMKRDDLIVGNGPALLDMVLYRYEGHSQSDKEDCRTLAEVEEWKKIDPIISFKELLLNEKIANAEDFLLVSSQINKDVDFALSLALNDKISPKSLFVRESMDNLVESNIAAGENSIVRESTGNMANSNVTNEENLIIRESDDNMANSNDTNEENLIIRESADNMANFKSTEEENLIVCESINKRAAPKIIGQDNSIVSEKREITYKQAITEAITEAFKRDSNIISYGVNVRDWGADSSVYSQINKIVGYDRLFNSPVSEACMVSAAIGYAMCGGAVIVDLMFSGFIGRAGDEIFNQLAKWQDLSGNYFKIPVIIRILTSRTYGAQHSQDWVSLVSHIPGLVVMYPATPFDAIGLFNAALSKRSPVVFFESKELYDKKEVFCNIPKNYYEIPIGVPEIRSVGNDFTFLTIGPALYEAIEAKNILNEKGYTIDIFDARTIVPFEYSKIISSVKKTGRIIIIGNENERSSVLTEFSHKINSLAFGFLKEPPIIIGAANNLTPASENIGDYLPTKKMIVSRVLQSLTDK